ncbi:DUF2255 family protein [Humibacter sp. RRB41]|uniref:DUF2255 family protein n=1 Tax=Humibacter sp. RRB41 TaxID=2919946 RepID=UPI001FAA3E31|nr:DUF2255 family protein [Humibacter sp. RRB41]
MPWNKADLAAVVGPDEIRVAPDRKDGTPGGFVIVWAVEHDGQLYARSARGARGAWYRRALASGHGRIRVVDTEFEVRYVDASEDADHAGIDAAYRAKYGRYGHTVDSVVGPAAHHVTVGIIPID